MSSRFARQGCCLGCGAVIGAFDVCPQCGLAQRGPLADRLRGLLEEADLALDELRQQSPQPGWKRDSLSAEFTPSQPEWSPDPALGADTTILEGRERLEGPGARSRPFVPYPGPQTIAVRRRRLPAMSTPAILLALGAISILVAAIVFVTVSWSDLSLAWKSAILLVVTAGFGGVAVWSVRKPLRASAETFGTLVVLFVGIDLLAARAGELAAVDELSWTAVLWMTTSAVAVVGTGLAWWARRSPVKSLVGPQIVAGVGFLGLVALTFDASEWRVEYTAFLLLVGTAVLGWLALRSGLSSLAAVFVALGLGLAALALAVSLLRLLDAETAGDVWGDGAGVGWLVWCLVLVAAAAVDRLQDEARTALSGLAWIGFTALLLRPVFGSGPDDHPDALVLAVAGAAVAHGVAARFVAAPWGSGARWAGWAPTLIGALLLAPALELFVEMVTPTGDQVWAIPVEAVVQAPPSLPAAPWAIGSSTAALLAAGWLLVTRQRWPEVLDVCLVLGFLAAASIVLSDVPLWLVVLLVALPAVFAVVAGSVLERLELVAAGGIVFAVALTAALMSPWTTAGVAVAGAACSAAVAWRMPSSVVVTVAAALVPALVALSGAAVVELLDHDAVVSGVVVVAVALVAWLLAQTGFLRDRQSCRIATEVGAAAVLVVGLALTSGDLMILAASMTIAGVVVVGTGVVRTDRRWASGPGGVLLAGASWVRLYDADVSVVEAYTLPSAIVLVGLAGWRLFAVPTASSMLLAPGLALALLPSLVLALDAPTSLRALLLGLGALAVMLAGAVLRWAVPLFAGGAVVAVLVLVNLGSQALALPRWTIFAAGGALLLFLGLTWERRLAELRRIGAMVAQLR